MDENSFFFHLSSGGDSRVLNAFTMDKEREGDQDKGRHLKFQPQTVGKGS